jgi:hypothetical protein
VLKIFKSKLKIQSALFANGIICPDILSQSNVGFG